MMETKLIKDAVAYRFRCQCVGMDELAEAGLTRAEVVDFLDRRISYAEAETVEKFVKWLDTDEAGIAEFARLYRLYLANNAIYEVLALTCQTAEDVEETAAFLVDYIDEILPVAKGRFN